MRKPATTPQPDLSVARIARVAWIFSFVVPLILAGLLCLAKSSADAAAIESPPAPGFEEELEEGYGEEECEIDEEGFVECEGLEGEEGEEGPFPPEECLLRTASARAFTYSSGHKLRLVLRYTATASTRVGIGYRLKGGRGTLNLGHVNRRFGRTGLFQITENLTEAGMSKAQAARNFFVKLSIPDAPGYCHRYYDVHLTIQKAAHNKVVWLSEPAFGS